MVCEVLQTLHKCITILIKLGFFQTPGFTKQEGRNTVFIQNGRETKVSETLDRVANRLGVPLTSVALAYALHKVRINLYYKLYV